ncbi:type III secretion system inner membrane ring lipoprotein SctJ [Desulfocurvus sp. DL9XJH121]
MNQHSGIRRILRLLSLLLIVLLLTGCMQNLYEGLQEREANEVLSALLKRGILADKQSEGKGLFTVRVDQAQVVNSLEILRRQGLPKDSFDNLGSMFPKEGMMSSPTEETARMSFALAQELADTCSQIDGVLTARVHVVLQEQDPVTEALTPASAATFIRFMPGSSVEQYVPHIRKLMANSVPNLKYDNASVFLYPAAETIIMPPPPEYRRLMGVDIAPYASGNFIVWMLAVLGAGLFLGFGGYWCKEQWARRKAAAEQAEEEDDA